MLIFNIVLIISLYILAFIYWDILIQNIYRYYLNWEKLAFLKNWYFSFKHMWKYIGVITWVWLYLLIPFWVLLAGFLVLFWLSYFWALSTVQWTTWSFALWLISIAIIAISMIYFFYLWIRLAFSYIALVFTDNLNVSTKLYIKESFAVTKWNVWKMIWIWFPFMIINLLIWEVFSLLGTDSQIINFLVSFIYFLIFWSINFMVYISLYLILKKDSWSNIKKIIQIKKEEV